MRSYQAPYNYDPSMPLDTYDSRPCTCPIPSQAAPSDYYFQQHTSPQQDISWCPQQPLPDLERFKINVTELAGKQMLPLEPRSILEPTIDDSTLLPMAQFTNIIEILRLRGMAEPEKTAFTVLDNRGQEITTTTAGSWTWETLFTRAEKISQMILHKSQLCHGSRVALVFRKSEILDFLAAFYGCMMAGMTAVPINVIEEFAEMTYILEYTKTELALTTEYSYKALTRDLSTHNGMDWPQGVTWWRTDTLDSKHNSKKDKSAIIEQWSHLELTLPDLAYIEYTKSPNGELKGVAISHRTILSQCHALKHALGSNPQKKSRTAVVSTATFTDNGQDTIASLPTVFGNRDELAFENVHPDVSLTWLEPRQQVGLVLGGLLGVFRGTQTVFAHSGITETPGLWEACVERYQVTLALGDYAGVREIIQNYKKYEGQPRMVSSLKKFMIDSVAVEPMVDQELMNEFLKPLGVSVPEQVVVPILSLPEHGGMVLSMRDHLMFPPGADLIDFGFEYDVPRGAGVEAQRTGLTSTRLKGHPAVSDTACHYLLDRKALKSNVIQVIASGEEAIERAAERGAVLVGTFGYASPQATLAVVDPETMALCQPTSVGEIWVDSPFIPLGFWELPIHSQSIFHALPLIVPIDTMIPEVYDPVPAGFLRTGLLGGLIEGRIVVFGLYEDRIQQKALQNHVSSEVKKELVGRYDRHYTSDLARTIMERIKGFSACITFECVVNDEHLPVICAETPRHLSADLAMLANSAKQAMEDYHGLRPYCIAIAQPGDLPRAYKNGKRIIHANLCRQMLELGRLTLSHLWTSTEGTVFNLAVGDDVAGGIWGLDALEVREAGLSAQARQFQFSFGDYPLEVLDERSKVNLSRFSSLAELLVWRSIMNPEEIAFLGMDHHGKNSKAITFRKFGIKVVSIADFIEKRGGFKTGDKVVLLFPNGIEFAATMFAVWMLGLVPIPIALPEASTLHEDIVMLMGLLTEMRASHLIGNSVTEEVMKQKSTTIHIKAYIDARQDAVIPTIFNICKAPKANRALGKESGYTSPPRAALATTAPAVICAHYSVDMRRTLVKVSHSSLMAQCRAYTVQCRLKSGIPLVSCWKSFAGMGLLQSCGLGIYVGAPTVLIQYADFLSVPQIFFEAIEQHGARNALMDYGMLEQVQATSTNFKFSAVRDFLVSTEERPRVEAHRTLEQILCDSSNNNSSSSTMPSWASNLHINSKFIGGMFGHMTNPFVTARSYMNIEPVRLHLSLKSLRRGVVKVTTEEEDPTGIWVEDSGIPVSGTSVAIVNPETCEICLSNEIGEIWISSEANVQAYTTAISPLTIEADAASMVDINIARFNAMILNSNSDNSNGRVSNLPIGSRQRYVRTGEVGFLWNLGNENFNGGRATSLLFVLGSIGETFEVNGLIHFPADVEATIEKAHPNIAASGSIVFQAAEAVVCVVQVRQPDVSVINLILSVMNQIMDNHQFMPDVIAIVDEGVLTKNRYGQKQRGKMLSLFMSAKMPLLYIHYPNGSLPQSMPEQMHAFDDQECRSTISSGTTADSISDGSSPLTSRTSGSLSLPPSWSSKGEQVVTDKKKFGSISSFRSSVSVAGSLRSTRSVRSLVGSIFYHSQSSAIEMAQQSQS